MVTPAQDLAVAFGMWHVIMVTSTQDLAVAVGMGHVIMVTPTKNSLTGPELRQQKIRK
jgi:hypothetical protein